MNSTKILIVTSEFPPQPGGIGNHALNLAVQLNKHGYVVTILTDMRSSNGEEEKKYDDTLKFNVIRIQRYPIIMLTYLKRILEYRRYLKTNNPNIVLASGKFSMWLVAFGLGRYNFKKTAVIHGSEVNSRKLWKKKLTNTALQQFDLIIAVSNYTKSLVAHLKLKTVHVIPNGFEIHKFEKDVTDNDLKGKPKLVTVGTLSERKGQHHVIEKLPHLLHIYPDIHYHMVGIPSEKEKLQKMAKSLNVDTHITFHGVLSQSKLRAILSKSDVFVMLSEKTKSGDVEGFGIALIEANYMGLPTIGAKGCGIEDAIANYKSGILVNANNLKEFELALKEIEQHKDFYKKNAQEWALKHSWNIIVKKYIALIEQI